MSTENAKDGKFSEYYVGLDIGTDSVGWCVTDPNYKVLKFNGKAMWGVRLFDAATPASERRAFRTQRRRIDRRRQRVKLTEELLADEIAKVDPVFFIRLQESKYCLDDKKEEVRQPYTLFSDKEYTDKDYHKEYPTIFHLRLALMQHAKHYDIRLYYLAISYMMKHRGHFLFSGDVTQATSFDNVYNELVQYVTDQMEIPFEAYDVLEVKSLLLDKRMSRIDKRKRMAEIYNLPTDKENSDMVKEALAAICGSVINLDKLFGDPELKDAEITKISFDDGIDDSKVDLLDLVLGDRFEYILKLKAVYDWSILSGLLSESNSVSEAQVKIYEKHKKDLKDLKYIVKKYMPEQYFEIFSDPKIKTNYGAYVGKVSRKGEALPDKRITEQKDFCDYLKGKLKNIINEKDIVLDRVKEEIENYTFMPKQISKGNSAIPYQVHMQDLKKIVDHLGEDYPAYKVKDDSGLSVCEKILRIYSFRIPYYVGPLNGYHKNQGGNSWIVCKEGKIFPWNFEEKVDLEASAEAFIRRLTNKCTYLLGEDVLPKNSLLYSRYMVLNELNNVRINGNRLPVEVKQRIYSDLFKNRKGRLSLKRLKEWMLKENLAEAEDAFSGIDEVFQASLQSYQDFYRIIGSRVDTDPLMVESIIKDIVIFGEDKRILRNRIAERFSDKLKNDEINAITRLSYAGWGRFSFELLSGIQDVDHETGELRTIIQSMWEGQENFMELMSSLHEYRDRIREHNEEIQENFGQRITYDLVRESYASPAVKRGIWQTLLIINEIKKIAGKAPDRIFIEVAREPEKNPKRKSSRKIQLLEAYKAIRGEEKEWAAELAKEINNREEREFNSKKLYLYYMQMQKDMYSGEIINFGELFTSEYDIDHIYPQSKTKDDSILNNLVLVRSGHNRDKGDEYPIPEKFRQPKLWNMLFEKGLITKEKYDRLMRKNPLSDEELASFISRQLVETRQTTKVVSQILEQVLPESQIVYSKANIVSDFRKEKEFWKARSVNDYHHAKDAYLNIVVGNVYYSKFTSNPVAFIQNMRKAGNKEKYSLNHMFDFDLVRNGKTAWKAGNGGSMDTVKKYMGKNNILFTRYATEKHGGFYDQMPLKKGSGQLLPLKSTDKRLNPQKYGGYNKPGIDYFMVVESDGKKGRIRTLEGVPVYLNGASRERLLSFCMDENGLGLKNPRIILQEIRINALMRLDGYPMHVSGKSNSRIAMKNAVQLVCSGKEERIFHRIEKINEKMKENKNYIIDDSDKITHEDIMSIYQLLTDKASDGIYEARPASQKNTLINGKERFAQLSMEEQCKTIGEIMHLFQCRFMSADLSKIGGVSQAGVFMVSNQLSKYKSAKLVNQSVTGLFVNEIDLLEVEK